MEEKNEELENANTNENLLLDKEESLLTNEVQPQNCNAENEEMQISTNDEQLNINNNAENNDNAQIATQKSEGEFFDEQNASNNNEHVKKEKVKKTKKVKQKKEKKKPKPFVYVLQLVLIGICLCGVVVCFCFWWQKISVKLEMPTLKVISLENKTYLFVENNSNAQGYNFSILENETGSVTNVYSTNNMVNFDSFLNRPKTFTIKAQSVGRFSFNNSSWSEDYSFTFFSRLKTPSISFVSNSNDSQIICSGIKDATYYNVYFEYLGSSNNENNSTLCNKFKLQNSQLNETVVFNLENLVKSQNKTDANFNKKIDAGLYKIYVTAGSDDMFETESFISNFVLYTKYNTLSEPNVLLVGENIKILQNKTETQFTKNFEVKVNGELYTIKQADFLKNASVVGEQYVAEFSLKDMYNKITYGNPAIIEITAISNSLYHKNSSAFLWQK